MKLTPTSIILPTSYCPSILYFKYLTSYQYAYIEAYEYYKRHSMRNRARILGVNGKILLTVPIVRKSYSKTRIKNIKIANNKWQKKHINSIKSAYGSSPFFIHYFDGIEKIINNHYTFLMDLNTEMVNFFLEIMKISLNIKYSNKYIKQYSSEFIDQRDQMSCELKYNFNDYHQVFNNNFTPNMSILDLIFNLGPNAKEYIYSITTN